jgi:hypothetical protein
MKTFLVFLPAFLFFLACSQKAASGRIVGEDVVLYSGCGASCTDFTTNQNWVSGNLTWGACPGTGTDNYYNFKATNGGQVCQLKLARDCANLYKVYQKPCSSGSCTSQVTDTKNGFLWKYEGQTIATLTISTGEIAIALQNGWTLQYGQGACVK